MCADALIKRNKAQNSGRERAADIYFCKLILQAIFLTSRLFTLPRIRCIILKITPSTDLIHGGYQSCATTTLIRAIPPSPKSYITAVVANCAATLLNRPTATNLSPADAALARLTEDMTISGGALPRRITLRNCRL